MAGAVRVARPAQQQRVDGKEIAAADHRIHIASKELTAGRGCLDIATI